MQLPTRADLVVVGAGLAGVACARVLADAGRDVCLLEAGEAVGGRVRTDEVDGFLLDRGFQVLNTGYPEVRRSCRPRRPRPVLLRQRSCCIATTCRRPCRR